MIMIEKTRRTVNIPKENFDVIKNFCDENTLDMPKWMVKNSLMKIDPQLVQKSLSDKLEEKLDDVEILNHKLLLTNRIFGVCNLNTKQKVAMVNIFDLAGTKKEADILYKIFSGDELFSSVVNLKKKDGF